MQPSLDKRQDFLNQFIQIERRMCAMLFFANCPNAVDDFNRAFPARVILFSVPLALSTLGVSPSSQREPAVLLKTMAADG
jgi:hypothetical protein